MLHEYLLNKRGQVRLLVFAIALAVCHFVAVVYNADFIDINTERLLVITVALLLLNGAHLLFLAFFNAYLRHPLTRYALLGLAFELLLGGVFIYGVIYGNLDGFNFKSLIDFFALVHKQGETWYILILPSMTTCAAAIIVELKEGRYYTVEPSKKTDISLLDDHL